MQTATHWIDHNFFVDVRSETISYTTFSSMFEMKLSLEIGL